MTKLKKTQQATAKRAANSNFFFSWRVGGHMSDKYLIIYVVIILTRNVGKRKRTCFPLTAYFSASLRGASVAEVDPEKDSFIFRKRHATLCHLRVVAFFSTRFTLLILWSFVNVYIVSRVFKYHNACMFKF